MKRCAWFLPACLLILGCGGSGDIKGTVTFKGEKLKFGTVTAIASNGANQGVIDADGNYEIRGVGLGKAKIYVYAQNPKVTEIVTEAASKDKEKAGKDKVTGRGQGKIGGKDAEILRNPNVIPDKYSDTTKDSLFTLNVVGGVNPFDIKLEP